MPLTTGEIAERIRRPGTDAGMIIERIKHWTRLKLLRPVDDHRGGTGRHFRYQELALIDVAILSALADAGASIQALGGDLFGALAKARPAFDEWEARGRQGALFLEIVSIRGKPFSAGSAEVRKGAPKLDPDAEVSMVINLSQVFARLPRGLAQEQEIAAIAARLADAGTSRKKARPRASKTGRQARRSKPK